MSQKNLLATVIAGGFLMAASSVFAVDKPVDFVTKAAEGNMTEIKLGQMALKKSHNPEVRAFAQQLITDHTQSEAKLKIAARADKITPPHALDHEHLDKINDFAKKGDEFDKDFINYMADDHRDDVNEFDDFAKNGERPHLKAYAQKTLPVLIHHKDMVDALKAKM